MGANADGRGVVGGSRDSLSCSSNVSAPSRSRPSVGSVRDFEKGFSIRIPLKKVAIPLDVANQILVLASSTVSGHVTGQIVAIAGGMEGRLLNTREDVGL